MASTYSTNLALELIGTGDQAGTWGNTTNTNLGTLIEQAISGYVTQAVSTGTDTTLTIPNGATGVARNMYIELTGTGGTNTNLVVPANKKLYFIYNNASGAVTVKVSGQTGVSVAAGEKKILVSNGTDIVEATTYLSSIPSSLTVTTLDATNVEVTNVKAKDGTAAIVISDTSGNVGIGGAAGASSKVEIAGTLPSSSNVSFGYYSSLVIPSTTTTAAQIFRSNPTTQAASFTLSDLSHFRAGVTGGTFGAGSTVSAQYGFHAQDNLTGATNNFGFYSNIASGSNRWNFFANGTADNYFAGNVGIGIGVPSCKLHLVGSVDTTFAPNVFNQRLTGTSSATSGNAGAGISFAGYTTGTSTITDLAFISGIKQSTVDGNYDGALIFGTRTNASGGGSFERMRIDSSGNVGIAKTSPTTTLDVSGTISDINGNVRAIPRSGAAKTSAYTLAITDVGEFIELGTGGGVVVPNGIFSTGDVVSVFNNTTGARPISLTITTAYQGGTDSDKAVLSLATRGVATILFISNSVCVVNGNVS